MRLISTAAAVALMAAYISISGSALQSLGGLVPQLGAGDVVMASTPSAVIARIDAAVMPLQQLLADTGIQLPQLP